MNAHGGSMAEMYFIGTPPGFGRGRLMPGSLGQGAAAPPEWQAMQPAPLAASSGPPHTSTAAPPGRVAGAGAGLLGFAAGEQSADFSAAVENAQAADAAGGGGPLAPALAHSGQEHRTHGFKASARSRPDGPPFAADCAQWPASPRDSLRPRPRAGGCTQSCEDVDAKLGGPAAQHYAGASAVSPSSASSAQGRPPPVTSSGGGGQKYKKSLLGVASLAELEAAAAALGLSARGLARTKSEDRMASWRSARDVASTRAATSRRSCSPGSQSPGPRLSPSKSRQVSNQSPARKNDDFLKCFLDHYETRAEMGLERGAAMSSSTGALGGHPSSARSTGPLAAGISAAPTQSTPQKRRPDRCLSPSASSGRVGSQSPSRGGSQVALHSSRRPGHESPCTRQYLLQVDAAAARERRARVGTTRASKSSAGTSTPTAPSPPPFTTCRSTSALAPGSTESGPSECGGVNLSDEREPEVRPVSQRASAPVLVRPPSGSTTRGRPSAAGRCTPPPPPPSAAPATPQRGRPLSGAGTPGRIGTPGASGASTPLAGGIRAGTPGTPAGGRGTPSGSASSSRSAPTTVPQKRRGPRETPVRTSLTQRCPSLSRRLGLT